MTTVTPMQIKTLQTLRRKAGLDDDAYRDRLRREAGVVSTKQLTRGQAITLIDGLRQQAEPRQAATAKMAGPYAAKLRALWLSGYNLGIIRDRRDSALLAFVKGQTGLDAVRFLHHASDAKKAIEALKAWLAREAHVDWRTEPRPYGYEYLNLPQAQVVLAQLGLLTRLSRRPWRLDDRLAAVFGKGVAPADLRSDAWVKLQMHLGDHVRSHFKAAAS